MEHPRDWIDVLQALLTPTIALLAISVGFAQWWTARNRLKLDLFNRRWDVYVASRKMLAEVVAHANASDEARTEFLIGIRGAKWLFDDKLDNYLLKELHVRVLNLQVATEMIDANRPPDEHQGYIDTKYKILEWMVAQDAAMDARFGPFLKMEETVSEWMHVHFRWLRPMLGWLRARWVEAKSKLGRHAE